MSDNDGIQRLLRAEEEAAQIVQKAREQRVQRLKQATIEAEQQVNKLRQQLQDEFNAEASSSKGGKDNSSFIQQLKKQQEAEIKKIDSEFEQNKQKVIDLLLCQCTTVSLEVSEALRQSLLIKEEQGQN